MNVTTAVQEYLDLMDDQRQNVFAALAGMSQANLWATPWRGGWSMGQILDHTRVLNASTLPLLRMTWFVNSKLAGLWQNRPYPVEIEDVYRRPGFPMKSGWLWPPRHNQEKPVSLERLAQSLAEVHTQYRLFYTSKDPCLLGNITLVDPAIGRLNLIQALRVGLYHDQLHYEDVIRMANEIRQHTTPVA